MSFSVSLIMSFPVSPVESVLWRAIPGLRSCSRKVGIRCANPALRKFVRTKLEF